MDASLEKIRELAASRGSNYVKGPSSMEDLPEKLAELGVLLLEKSRLVETLHADALKHELIEVQNKVDDLRKALFANKLLAK